MKEYLLLIALLLFPLIFPLIMGASRLSTFDPQITSLSFPHADEVSKGEGFLVIADRRIFALMAFLNAAGYDKEAASQQMHPVRVRVRELVENNLAKSPKKLQAYRKYYREKDVAIFHYLDFALSLSADYPFRRIRPDSELSYPHTARKLNDLPETLNDFWITAELDKVWSEVKPDYIAEIKKYDFDRMKRKLSFIWEYLKMKRSDTYILVNIPNLLDTHYQAIAARYENYYYSVESPGSHAYDLNIHEYLHSIINSLVRTNYDKYKTQLQSYYKAGKDKPLAQTYQDPVVFTYECLVRALDLRLRVRLDDVPSVQKRAEAMVADVTSKGLTLTQPFYHLLIEYEKSGQRFDEFLPSMLGQLTKYTG
jgi:hypothetical protein